MADFMFGIVKGTNPLTVTIEQKMTVEKEHLIVPESLTDYTVKCEIDGSTKDLKVKNALKTGDKIILLREQGGQRFLILDKF